MDLAGTRPSAGTRLSTACTALSRPGRRCTACPPLSRALFPKLVRGPGDTWVLHHDPTPSPALIFGMVTSALSMIGVDTDAFSGVCCRMSGLTRAIASPGPSEAGVPESILWTQSGHSQDRAARRYARLTNQDRLYDTWRAFRL